MATTDLGEDAGVFTTTVSLEKSALTASKHRIYREEGDGRDLVFRGHGPLAPVVWRPSQSLMIVAYCGGSIEEVTSSILARTTPSENARIIRIEIVNNPGFSFAGKEICPVEL